MFNLLLKLILFFPYFFLKIATRSANTLGIQIDSKAATEVAKRSRGTPRIVNRLLKRVRDFSSVLQHDSITEGDAKLALSKLDIDDLGLDMIDRALLTSMIEKFNGGPVGLETLAATINEDANTLEDVYEPYLLQLGFIARTPKGRVALASSYEHFGVPLSEDKKAQLQALKAVSDDGIY